MTPDRLRLLALTRYAADGASSRIRFEQYLPALAPGFAVECRSLFGSDYLPRLYAGDSTLLPAVAALARRLVLLLQAGRPDLLFIEKEALPWLPAALELRLLPRRVPYVLDIDDAWFHRYDLHRSAVVRRLLGHKIDALMRGAALVLAGNDYLAARARAAGARRIEIVPSVVDTDRLQPARGPRPPGGPVVIGWIGSPVTARYLLPMAPALRAACREGGALLHVIGASDPGLPGVPCRVDPWSFEHEAEYLQQFDIGIMPLADTPWERGKCGFKIIQYMAAGLPVVATPVGVNRDLVNDAVGFLAGTEAEWGAALKRLIRDAGLRARLGAAGRERAMREYSLALWGPRVAGLLAAAATGAQAQHAVAA